MTNPTNDSHPPVLEFLDQLLRELPVAEDADAIDEALRRPPRTTSAESAAHSDALARFRAEVRNGAVHAETARTVIALIRGLVAALGAAS